MCVIGYRYVFYGFEIWILDIGYFVYGYLVYKIWLWILGLCIWMWVIGYGYVFMGLKFKYWIFWIWVFGLYFKLWASIILF